MKHLFARLVSLVLCLAMLAALLTSCGVTSGTDKKPDPTEDEGEETDVGGSAVVINEVCSKNTYYPHPDDGVTYDWIELYNRTDREVSLAGWGISDNETKVKHRFGSSVSVPARGFLLLWARGEENMIGQEDDGTELPFSISKNGEGLYLFSPRGAVVDTMDVPALYDNVSFGYMTDGSGALAKMTPTPAASNDEADVYWNLDASVASFSHESGFYERAFTLRLSVPEGYTVYYTDNCTTPSEHSAVFPAEGVRVTDATPKMNKYSAMYTGVLEQAYTGYSKLYGIARDTVDKCTVLRFLVSDGKGLSTPVITKSYFIGEQYDGATDGYANMAVVSLVTEPDNLYGTKNGLFVNSKYWTKTDDERPVNFTYFDAEQQYVFDQDVGMRLHGTSTRGYNQKSMTLFARRRYGAGMFEQSILGDAKECGSLVLRTDGTTKLQEGFLESFVSDRDIATSDYIPTVVFVDGEYYGVFNLTERFSEDYCAAYYGVNEDNVYIVKKGSEENVSGALAAYKSTFSNLFSTDLSRTSNWTKFSNAVDVQSLADYLAAQVYLCNMDWSFAQNIAVWRVIDPSLEDPSNPYADGKWRFVLYDLDFAAGCWKRVANWKGESAKSYSAATNAFTTPMPFAGNGVAAMTQMQSLLKSPEFCRIFALTFQDLCNVNFEPTATVQSTQAAIERIRYSMPKHFARFGVPIAAYKSGSTEGGSDSFWKVETYFGGYQPVQGTPPIAISAATWANEMQFLVDFFRDRGTYARVHLAEYLGLSGEQVTVTLAADNPAAGKLTLNGATSVPLSSGGTWQGTYTTDYPLTVTAEAKSGYVFTGWTVSGATLSSATDSTVSVTFSGAFTLTAHYAPLS